MNTYDIISKKKHGEELTASEIEFIVDGYTKGSIPDYQVSALLMAICFNGMTDKELSTLTMAIAKSGDTVDLSEFGALAADKHSTGGVGDKTTLIVAPLVASVGVKVAKMSGRGLGHTGGTVDKLESIPGYKTDVSSEDFYSQVRRIGIAVVGQSGNLAPADKKLYALRDVTATVDSVPLIASSIMGKKLASGANSIVLDVKYGSGSFMKTPECARELADKMVRIGQANGRRVAALITNMDVPLGYAIGNSLEVKEAVDTLRGNGPEDLTEVCLALSSAMVSLALGLGEREAYNTVKEALADGRAYGKFKEWITAQGGDISYIEDTDMLPRSEYSFDVLAEEDGYISFMDAEALGLAAVSLGAGRATKSDIIDHAAGIVLKKKTADKVKRGECIMTLYSNKKESLEPEGARIMEGIRYSNSAPERQSTVHSKVY
jgi:pyrimidine-nucleoside phosphorylase